MFIQRFIVTLLCCLSLSAVAQSGGAGRPAPAPGAAGKVDLIQGDVRIYDTTQKPRTGKVGDDVAEGESIVTGGDGELHMQMADGGYIAVRPNTKMRISTFKAEGGDNDKSVINLLVGSFRSISGWIGKYNRSNYEIRTPTATIGIRGTDHEPMVIPEGSTDGEAGTYDKVNAGGTFIQTPHGRVEVAEHKAAFAPHMGTVAPRLLNNIPHFFQPTRNEHLLEHRHETIQRTLDERREARRRIVEPRKGGADRAMERRRDEHGRPGAVQERRRENGMQREQRSHTAAANKFAEPRPEGNRRQELIKERQQAQHNIGEQRQQKMQELHKQREEEHRSREKSLKRERRFPE